MFFSSSLFAQKTYWKYEKTIPILKTAIDIEYLMGKISKGDYIIHNKKNNNILFYSKSNLLKKTFKFDKNKIIEDKLKLLFRAGVDDIYMFTFSKTDEKDFNENVKKNKD